MCLHALVENDIRITAMNEKMKRKENSLAALDELIDIIDKLRSPDGCPWDRKQTSVTLKPYLVEETYEALDAIDSGDAAHLREELGDVLLQIMLHAQIAYECDEFHIGHVIEGLSRKMIHRHPHVFSDTSVDGADDVIRNWEKIKAKEKNGRGVLEGVPSALPGLLKAYRMGQKVSRVGFDWPDISGVRGKVDEELDELDEAVAEGDSAKIEHEMGDLLFAVAQWARHLGIDPEESLRQCCTRFENRFAFVEKNANDAGQRLSDITPEELDNYWEQAKKNERY